MPRLRPGEADKESRIFISYAREDSAIAKRLYNDLKRRGYNPWLDKHDLLPGQQWKIAIEDAIKESSFFLALISSNSIVKRGFAQREVHRALDVLEELPDDDIFLIPVRLDDCRPSIRKLEEINWVDLFHSYEDGLENILKAIETHSKSPFFKLETEELQVDYDQLGTDNGEPEEGSAEEMEKEASNQRQEAYLTYLRERFDHIDGITIEKAKNKAYVGTSGRYVKLTRPTLQYFDSHTFDKIEFRGSLIELPDNIAPHLSHLKCSELVIEPLMSLTPQIAKSLARWKGNYLRIAAETILWQAVEALVEWKGKRLELNGLGSLDKEAAQHLARWQGDCLQLGSVHHMSPEAAALLSRWPGQELLLEGLEELTVDAARNLAQWEGDSLHLLKVRSFPAESARHISGWSGECLDLTDVRRIPLATLEHLAGWQGNKLILDQMDGLSPARARVISSWPGNHLSLSRVGKIGGRAALSLYNWRGKILTLSENEASKSAIFYLNQWGIISGDFGKWGDASIKRRECLPSRPAKQFGILPTLLEAYSDSSSWYPQATKEPAREMIRLELLRSKIYKSTVTASLRHASLTLLALSAVSILLLLAARSDFMKSTLSILHAGESLFYPEPSFWEGTLRVLRLIARILLVLVVPIILGLLALLRYVIANNMFDKLPSEIARVIEKRFDRISIIVALIGIAPVTLYYAGSVFPGTLEVSLLDFFESIEQSRASADGFASGAWHGLAGPVRALSLGFPPQSQSSNGWLFYYPGYILGAFVGMLGLIYAPLFLLWGLLGFNGERRDLAVTELIERSHILVYARVWVLSCVFWFIALVAGIWL